MSTYATQIQSACTQDLSLQNPQAQQALFGFRAYPTLYAASCLTNPRTGNYCFADAVSNSSAPASSYVYYLPLNVQLPANSQPACTDCLKNTMNIFSQQAGNESSALWNTYGPAAAQVDGLCGSGFVQQSVVHNAAAKRGGVTLWALSALVLVWFFC